jgi:alanine racemase
MTHFSDADGARGIAHQLEAFERATRDLPGERSIANSAATCATPSSGARRLGAPRHRAVRQRPRLPRARRGPLAAAADQTLSTQLISVQTLKAGDTIGYGSNFTAEGPLTIGVAAVGYADGYPRHCNTGTPVLVNGVRTRMVGRVSMDMITVDLTGVPEAKFGSEVTLWGKSAKTGAVLPIDEVARAAGTVGYELMCAVAQRVPFAPAESE